MSDLRRDLVGTIRSAWQNVLAGRPDLAADLRHMLEHTADLSLGTPARESENSAAHRHLGPAVVLAESGPLGEVARALAPVGLTLPWGYNYPDQDPDLAANVAFAELVGPSGPFLSNRLRLGFTLMGPRLLYPDHAHPAIELYHVMAGRPTWTADGVTTEREAGEFVLHPSEVSHAMRTYDEPLLAIYAWRGDIVSPSRYT